MLLVKRINFCQSIHHLCCYSIHRHFKVTPFGGETNDPFYTDLPKPCRTKSQRKPYPTPMKILISRAKQERELRKINPCRVLENPPHNGLLVPELVPVSHKVYWARESLLIGISKLLPFVPVLRCRFCSEVHIGSVGHEIRTCTGPRSGFRRAVHDWRKGSLHDVIYFPKSFHLYDRVGKARVVHNDRFDVPRIPAILELCLQAGVNLDKYPVRRRTKPVYCIEGRIEDFDSDVDENVHCDDVDPKSHDSEVDENVHCDDVDPKSHDCLLDSGSMSSAKDMESDSKDNHIHPTVLLNPEQGESLENVSIGTLKSWLEMISGTRKIMEKYSVWTCGYCPEVHVGPKGHKVRMCKASKHQSRDGMHAWQEATIDDLVGPNYVWHVRDPFGPPLDNNLKRYYGKAPAIIELCVQAGAPIPEQYRSMLRLDVVPPDRDEVDLVA